MIIGAVVLWRRPGGNVIVAVALVPIAAAALVWAAGEPVFNERNLLPAAPYLAILLAGALSGLPERLVVPMAAVGIAATVAGAAFAQTTLGRIDYDEVADALVAAGWTPNDPTLIHVPEAEASAWLAVGWYLPGRPKLARGPSGDKECASFVVAHSSSLAAQRDQVDVVRELTSYDHPSIGHEDGHIVVGRARTGTDLPGRAFHVRGRPVGCAAQSP
jgi:hypothetical protein